MLTRWLNRFETAPGFAVGIGITTPHFHYSRERIWADWVVDPICGG
jgi:hypothetical protein